MLMRLEPTERARRRLFHAALGLPRGDSLEYLFILLRRRWPLLPRLVAKDDFPSNARLARAVRRLFDQVIYREFGSLPANLFGRSMIGRKKQLISVEQAKAIRHERKPSPLTA